MKRFANSGSNLFFRGSSFYERGWRGRSVFVQAQPRSPHRTFAWSCRWVCAALLLFLLAGQAQAAPSLRLLPESLHLTGPSAQQMLVAEKLAGSHFAGQLTNGISFESSDPQVVQVTDGIARPVGNGKTLITLRAHDQTITAPVVVDGMERPVQWSFRNNVQPILAKKGCNAGACHGAAAGQNGFRLSLRGYDDEGDWLALTRQSLGRRIIPSDPGHSLMLLKPLGAVPHKGGKRFEVNSAEFKILSEWIASGAPGLSKDDPRIERIELLPDHVILRPGASQQLLVRAFFSDAHSEDVTRWVKFTDSNSSVTQVDEAGQVKVLGFGEGAITAWYLSRIAIGTVTVPYTNQLSPDLFASAKRRNFIDGLVLEKLQSLNLPPSERCSDADFLRRAYIDTVGVIPSIEETRAFLSDTSATKRDQLIEKLLARPEFVDYWSYKWSDLLLVSSRQLRTPAMWSFYNWIHQNVAANTPWDLFVRKIVTAQGDTLENGAANFFVLHEDPRALSETTSQAFLGMSINCAKCHNHPMEKWTNDQYYQMANLFARVRKKSGPADGENVVFVAAQGDLIQPLRGRPQPPAPLEGTPLPIDDPQDRRRYLADWLVSAENPYFSRAIVNRIWANFFGVGLVENVDDLRVTNPASHEKLLSAAAHYLAEHHFDLKELMRAILQSETYQRSSEPLPGNKADDRFYSHFYPRRLMAEVMLDSISKVTGVPSKFPNYPEGWRAVQLPDSNVPSYFLEAFGRPERAKTCVCERSAEPSVTQMLHISNGETINKKLAEPNNRLGELLAAKTSAEKIIEEAYLSALTRYPTTAEKEKMLRQFQSAGPNELRPLLEDVYWALLSSREFLFNH